MTMLRNLSFVLLLGGAAGAFANPAMVEGEIRKVDKDASKLTIKHAELKNLGMMPMTMVFRVKDKVMLDKLAAGDKVRFAADRIDGAITVIAIEAVK